MQKMHEKRDETALIKSPDLHQQRTLENYKSAGKLMLGANIEIYKLVKTFKKRFRWHTNHSSLRRLPGIKLLRVLEYAMVCWLGRENIIWFLSPSLYDNAAAVLFSVNYKAHQTLKRIM